MTKTFTRFVNAKSLMSLLFLLLVCQVRANDGLVHIFISVKQQVQKELSSTMENATVTFSCPNGILSNPDFESNLSGWQTTGSTTSITTDAYNGTKAIVITGNDGGVQQAISATPGNYYSYSMYGKRSGSATTTAGLEFYDASWNYLSGEHYEVTSTDWEYNEKTAMAPANAVYVMFSGRSNSGSGNAYFDSFCTEEWSVAEPTCNGNSCALSPNSNDVIMILDDSGDGTGTKEYDNANLILCSNDDGTLSIKGNIFNGQDAHWDPANAVNCGLTDGWIVDFLLSDLEVWSEFQGPYEQVAGCESNHVNWDYWKVNGTFTGIGCNEGRTLYMFPHQNGYKLQIGTGGNSQSCNFGMSTWFEGSEGDKNIVGDIYAHLDAACYAALRPTEICDNNKDDDGDGLVDCKDADCGGNSTATASTDVPKSISTTDIVTITSTLDIASTDTILDINLINLDIDHTYIDDLKISLTSPTGITVLLMDQPCVSQNDIKIDLDDEASTGAWPCPPVDGMAYKPSNVLSAFDGIPANGTWVLTIEDVYAADGGTLNSWSLEIESECKVEICDDGIDNDGDGLIDIEDPDCAGSCIVDCDNMYSFEWFDGTNGNKWEITNGESTITRVYTISGANGDYDVSVTLDNPDGQNIDFANCGGPGNHFYTATCNATNATADCDGDPGTTDGQFSYGCGYLTFGVTAANSDQETSITYSFETPTQICDFQIGDIDFQGTGIPNIDNWQDEVNVSANLNGTPVSLNANAGENVTIVGNNTTELGLLAGYGTTSCCNLDHNDASGHAFVTTLGEVNSITFSYSNGPDDDGQSDDHAIRLSGFDFCPSPKEICDDGIDNDGDNLVDSFDPGCSCQSSEMPNIDFNFTPTGTAVSAGSNPSEIWAAYGLHMTTNDPSSHPIMIFDSSNPSGGDWDLGTPNGDFGGPGSGGGGEQGELGENNTSLGNSLIISQNGNANNPNDNSSGGTITFDFDYNVDISSVEIVDLDYGSTNSYIKVFDVNSSLLVEKPLIAYGNNSYQKVALEAIGARKMEIYANTSFSVATLLFCDDDLPTATIGDLVWNDGNADGDYTGEDGLADVEVNLYNDSGDLLAKTTTNTSGFYQFKDLADGTYRVAINAPSGYTGTHDLNGGNDNDSGNFTINNGELMNNVDFGLNDGTIVAPSPCDGNADFAQGVVRNGAATNAVGLADGVTTEVGHVSDYLIVELEDELPVGSIYTIHMSGRGGSATTDVFEAPVGTNLPSSQQDSPVGFTFIFILIEDLVILRLMLLHMSYRVKKFVGMAKTMIMMA